MALLFASLTPSAPRLDSLPPQVVKHPPNLDVAANSPAVNAGSTSLTCSVGHCGSGTSIYGSTDYAGKPRVNARGQINIGPTSNNDENKRSYGTGASTRTSSP